MSMQKIVAFIKGFIYNILLYCCNFCCRDAMRKGKMELLYTSDFEEYILTDFEGESFYIAKGYDRILKMTFGDYMKLPPEDQRVVRHGEFNYYLK